MNQPNANDPGNSVEAKLPRRDWILLPALSLMTICLIVVSAGLFERWMFATSYGSGEDCIVFNDPATGARGIPNSVCREKIPEGEVTEYRFNSCGYRASKECGPKPSGAYRIVMIGGSYAMGMRVPIEKTFATSLPAELSRRTGRNIEIYNEAMPWRPPHVLAQHFNEVLAAKPDMILWIFTPSDVWNPSFLPPPHQAEAPRPVSVYRRVRHALGILLNQAEVKLLAHSVMFRHFLYNSQSQTIASYLAMKRDGACVWNIHGPEFLRVEPCSYWRDHFRDLDGDVSEMEAQATAAGVPFAAVLLPERAQAAMISRGEWPADFDPYKLDNELRAMIVNHGGIYLDVLPAFRTIPNSERGFFTDEGHPNAYGHAMISAMLANELTNGAVPALNVSASQKAEVEGGR